MLVRHGSGAGGFTLALGLLAVVAGTGVYGLSKVGGLYGDTVATSNLDGTVNDVVLTAVSGGLRTWLQSRGVRTEGLELRALETPEEQIAVFESLDEDDQVALLRALVDGKAENDATFERMIELYVARDLAGIEALTESVESSGEAELVARFMERLKVQRDGIMFDRLQPMMPKGGLFIAVGALHLTGESGLLARFAAAGYDVSAVH